MTEDSVVHTCNVQYNHVHKDFILFIFFLGGGGGGEILKEINCQNHQTSLARISVSICSIWSWSLRSSEGIGKNIR